MSLAERGKTERTDSGRKPRYIAKSSEGHVREIEREIYSHLVWDCQDKTFVALTVSEATAKNYAAQMNEKGFIEP